MLRLDRSISLALVRPLRAILCNKQGERCLPILMYHSVSEDPEPSVSDYFRVCVSASRFREQMEWLQKAGFRGVSLSEGLSSLGRPVNGPRPVAITFDDGYRDFNDAAFPVLAEAGFGATMYISTAYIGNDRCVLKGRECLSWDEVRGLQRSGIEFGSHTVTHPTLYEQSWLDIEEELHTSKACIEQELGVACTAFAYPYAFPGADRHFVERFKSALSHVGYQTCVTTTVGRAFSDCDRLELRRLPVNQADDRSLLLAKLNGNYDWFGRLQSSKKSLMLRISSSRQRSTLD